MGASITPENLTVRYAKRPTSTEPHYYRTICRNSRVRMPRGRSDAYASSWRWTGTADQYGVPGYLDKPFSYAMWNLAAACKRCNMQFKRSGDGFVVDTDDSTKFQDSDNYRFVHPNFDAYSEHLIRLEAQVDTKNIVVFVKTAGSEKAIYTHDFFALHELQVDSFDKAQGLEGEGPETELAAKVRELAKQFDQ